MAEVFGIVAGAVGVAVVAIEATRGILDAINSAKVISNKVRV